MYSFFIEQIILSIKFGKRDEKINMGLQNESGPKSVAKGSHFMFKFLSKISGGSWFESILSR